MKLNETNCPDEAGAETLRCVAAAALTVIEAVVPVIDAVTVSVAVTVWLPAVFRVVENDPVPAVKLVLENSVAAPSVLVKCTVPPYPVAVLLNASCAVTVTLKAPPAVPGTLPHFCRMSSRR